MKLPFDQGVTLNMKYKRNAERTSTIDDFAQRIIEEESSGCNAPIDDSLGRYITSCLRNADPSLQLQDIPEFDSLMELLQEHCHIPSSAAETTLQRISDSLASSQHNLSSFSSFPGEFDAGDLPISPLAAGSLLPVDLLDEDGGKEGFIKAESVKKTGAPVMDASSFPPLGSMESSSKKKSAVGTKKTTNVLADPLSAVDTHLTAGTSSHFRTSRSQQHPPSAPEIQQTHVPYEQQSFQQYYYGTSQILLSMNAELSPEAALAASIMANADVNLAQYIIEATLAQVPICRNFVTGEGCYRADCTFSHDINNHTCLFWLKSRCGKGNQCRFLHAFSDQFIQSVECTPEYAICEDKPYDQYHQDDGAWTASHQPSANSFANIASHGYDNKQSFANEEEFPRISATKQRVRTVPIPQDLWNTHENRDSSVFYIADPMDRYLAVQRQTGNPRDDVIDLHFQSLQTFGSVLDQVLDTKLTSMDAVWIVTGTGHHVASRTHQKGGGALESAVLDYLKDLYNVARGRDKAGQGGVLLVKKKN